MITTSLVNICIITYNHEKYIREAIEGVLMQKTPFPFQLIIGEDCSTDNTWEICKEYEKKYPELIKLLPQPETNLGMMPNFIRTLKACKGKYIALCEGDDYWTDPLKLQKQVDFLEKNEDYIICFHNVDIWKEKSKELIKDYITKDVNETTSVEDLAQENYIHTPSVVLRNFQIEFPNWFSKVPYGDYALYSLNALKGKIYKLNETMAVYRVHDKGLMKKLKNLSLKDKTSFNLNIIPLYEHMYSETDLIIYQKNIYVLIQNNRKYYLRIKDFYNSSICANKLKTKYKSHIKFKQHISLFLTVFSPYLLYFLYKIQNKVATLLSNKVLF